MTGYLFAKLLVLYANTFYLVYPSEKEVKLAKREYARDIGKYSREQIDTAVKHLAKLAVSSDRQNRIYREPNIPAILAMMDQTVRTCAAHELFLPEPPETEAEKAARIEIGQRECSKIMGMFDDE